MRRAMPPRFWRWLLGRLAGREESELLLAELDLEFESRFEAGRLAAEVWYRRQVLRSAFPVLRERLTVGAQRWRTDPVNVNERRRRSVLASWVQEFRYVVRSLSRAPGFTLIVVLTLALGIGANASVFSVVNALMLQPVAYPNAERLVVAWEISPGSGESYMYLSPPNLQDWRDRVRSLEALAAFAAADQFVTLPEETLRVRGALVSWNLGRTLGVQPRLGRDFRPEDDVAGAPPVALISEELWRERFGAREDVVGSPIRLSTGEATVVGVLPASFDFPPAINLEGQVIPQHAQIFLPFALDYAAQHRQAHYMTAIGLLRDGATLESVRAELSTVARALAVEYPATNEGRGATAVPINYAVLGEFGTALKLLLGAVGLVLLIACVNVANLMLGRSTTRQREYAIRAALGAGQRPLLRQTIVESQVLATLGGIVGLAAAVVGTRLLVRIAPATIPNLDQVSVDGPVVAFAIAISMLTGLLFGLVPALRTRAPNLQALMMLGGRGGVTRSESRLRGGLIIAEVALSLLLLFGAGLLLRSLRALQRIDAGVAIENVLTARLSLASTLFPDAARVRSTYAELEQRLAALPGVEAAGFAFNVPLASDFQGTSARFEGEAPPGPDEDRRTHFTSTTPGYFAAMGIPLLAGRVHDQRDDADAPPVVVVNKAFADRFFPGGDALSHRLLWQQPVAIIGVVGDVRLESITDEPRPIIYFPHAQTNSYRSMTAIVRSGLPPEALLTSVRSEIRSVDPGIPVFDVATMNQVIARALAGPRFSATLLMVFAFLALALAAVGIYGVVSYMVAQQTRDIAVRMALGARPNDELGRVIGSGLRLVSLGLILGLLAAFATGRVLTSLLFQVQPTDPVVLLGVSAFLMLTAVVAAAVPAIRASRTSPLTVLRE